MGLNQTVDLIKHRVFSSMWLGVDLRRDTKKTMYVPKRLDYVLKYANYSRFDSQHELGEPVGPLKEHENLHFDNAQDIHMRQTVPSMIWFANHLKLALIACFVSYVKWVQTSTLGSIWLVCRWMHGINTQ